MFLIDTNVLIQALKQNQPDAKTLDSLAAKGNIYISVITEAEFLSKASVKEKRGLEKILHVSQIINIDSQVARQAAKYRTQFKKTSRTKLLDSLIAAQAKIYKLTLVTNNKSDFPMTDIKIVKPA